MTGLVWLSISFDTRGLQEYTPLCILLYTILTDSKQPVFLFSKELYTGPLIWDPPFILVICLILMSFQDS